MATTTTVTKRTIEIEAIAADWYVTAADPNGLGESNESDSALQVKSISFIPSDTDDVLVIKDSYNGTAGAATKIKLSADSTTDQKIHYFGDKGEKFHPFIDYSECTFGTVANVKVLISLA